MNEQELPGEPGVERLVRAHLEREAETFDPRSAFERIQRELAGETKVTLSLPAKRGPRRLVLRWAAATAAAAAVLVGVLLFSQHRPVLAKGETVLREARQAHRLPVDRCYLVEVRRESSLAAEVSPSMPQVRQTRLWTRGDRFWVESVHPEERWAWGRDKQNRFWIAFGPHTAVRLDANEVPFGLNLFCDLHSLNVEQLLGDVLSHFTTTREDPEEGSDTSVIRIHATTPAALLPYPSTESLDLEIDAETRVIRRMVARRVLDGEPFATVTYSLTESDTRDPSEYLLEGHLTDPAQIFTKDHEPQRRKELLTRWFRPRAGQWFRSPEAVRSGVK